MGLGNLWPGASRREENHQQWEDTDRRGAIRAKGRHALELRARSQPRRAQTRRERNNRREY